MTNLLSPKLGNFGWSLPMSRTLTLVELKRLNIVNLRLLFALIYSIYGKKNAVPIGVPLTYLLNLLNQDRDIKLSYYQIQRIITKLIKIGIIERFTKKIKTNPQDIHSFKSQSFYRLNFPNLF